MDILSLAIPYDFIAARTTLTWREVRFGLESDLVSRDLPGELAGALLETQPSPDPSVLELACLDPGESPRPYVERLAEAEAPEPIEDIKSKWLYLVLAWVYEHRADFDKPLQTVEIVYADFDYPEEIEGFVAYMPEKEAPLQGPAQAEQRLYARWAAWLAEQAARYGAG